MCLVFLNVHNDDVYANIYFCIFFIRSFWHKYMGNTRNYLKLKDIVLTSLATIKRVELIQHRIHKLIWLIEVQFKQQYGTIGNSDHRAASLLLFRPPGSVKFRTFFYGNKYFVNWVKIVLCQFESAIVNSNISILHKEILQTFTKTATITLDLTLLTTSSPNIDIQPSYSTTCYGRQGRFRPPRHPVFAWS